MNPKDKEIQKKFESGNYPHGDDLDTRAYNTVFRALETDPAYRLSANPSEVVARIRAREKRRELRDYLWFAGGLSFLAISFLLTVLYTGFRLNWGFLNALADYKGLFVFGAGVIALLNWLDKRLLRARLLRM